MPESLWYIANAQRPIWQLLTAVRVPLLVIAGFGVFVLDTALEGVAADAARYVATDRPHQLWLLAPLILLAGIALRFCSEFMISVVSPNLRTHGRVMWAIARALPRLIGAALGLVVSYRFYLVFTQEGGNELGASARLQLWEVLATYVAFALLTAAAPRRLFVEDDNHEQALHRRLLTQEPWTHAIGALLLLAAIGTFFLFWDWTNVAPAQDVGPFGVLLLWAFAAAMYFTPVSLLSHLSRIPILSLLALWAFMISALNGNDNHEIRTVEGAKLDAECYFTMGTEDEGVRPCEPYFEDSINLFGWLDSREDLDLYEHYPVFVVAAEGGGIRSAYLTAQALEIIQRHCPSFAPHTLAMSGVSGGSVGVASFVQFWDAQLRKTPPINRSAACGSVIDPRPSRTVAHGEKGLSWVFSEDHLSPLLAATLFGDALQRIIPYPFSELDRARSLECSYERAMSSITGAGRADCSEDSPKLSDLYREGSRRLPYLFLNVTRVSDGAQMQIAAARHIAHDTADTRTTDKGESLQSAINPSRSSSTPYRDLPISTAAFLSARFPFIMPPARLPENSNASGGGRVIDGGVFENSGVRHAMHIVEDLREASYVARGRLKPQTRKALERGLDFRLLVLRWVPCYSTSDHCEVDATSWSVLREPPERAEAEGLAELGSPIRALLRARVAHGLDELTALEREIKRWKEHLELTEGKFPFVRNRYNADVLVFRGSPAIPLSWSLSAWARRDLDAALERAFLPFSSKDGCSSNFGSAACGIANALQPCKTAASRSKEAEKRKPSEEVVSSSDGEHVGDCEKGNTILEDAGPTDTMPPLPELDRCEGCEPAKP